MLPATIFAALGALGRLLLSAASALVCFLSLRRAPTYRLWLAAVGVTEWGHGLAPLALAALLRPYRRAIGFPAWTLGAAAGVVGALPLLRALPLARRLPDELVAAFGPVQPRTRPGAPPRPAPLVSLDLLRGVASPTVRCDRLAYRCAAGQELRLDLYRPLPACPSNGPAGKGVGGDEAGLPVVVVVHGGGWESGDAGQLPEVNRYLAARGYAVAAICYRLAPQHPFPAALEDVLAAVAHLKAHAMELGLDGGRIVLYGRSAGGHLALLAAYTARDPAIRGVVALYPPIDLRWGYANPAARRVIDSCAVLERFLGGTPETASAAYDAASPLTFVGPESPPTLLVHGGQDVMASPLHSRWLAQRLAAHDRPHLLLELPWATHGFEANLSGPGGQLLLYALERFLSAVV
ncbi:MAG TPA: alpha/beta hydrolase [Roseiflexaceae bacterium]|nr:alpha/beta hydrolase [Roseiflexaceae bacterium]